MNKETTQVEFLLNGEHHSIQLDPGISTLNMLKNHFLLMGTKEGCGEGDCGACTVAIGSLVNNKLEFRAIASCIYPAIKLQGKHLITIEGLGNHTKLHVIQKHIIDSYGVQCGFCSPGIIMSFFALFARNVHPSMEEVEIALQGNICRCTGYEGIRNAGTTLINQFTDVPDEKLSKLIVPNYVFKTLHILNEIPTNPGTRTYHVPHTLQEFLSIADSGEPIILISGGTDIQVQMKQQKISKGKSLVDISRIAELHFIREENEILYIGSQLSISACVEHPLVRRYVPEFYRVTKLMASTQIRNVATIAGNLANASPIGDSTVLLLALNASVGILRHHSKKVERVMLRDFFIAYKKTSLEPGDLLIDIGIPLHTDIEIRRSVHFEKTSRRKDVDIATVNSASVMYFKDNAIVGWDIAFGGVGPIPFALENINREEKWSSRFDESLLSEAGNTLLHQCSTLDDVRGSSAYRNLLVKNHVIKHFVAHTTEDGQEV